jgi:hypothetical protein
MTVYTISNAKQLLLALHTIQANEGSHNWASSGESVGRIAVS